MQCIAEDRRSPKPHPTFRLTTSYHFVIFHILNAGVAQLVEHNLAKVGVTGSSPATRSIEIRELADIG